MNFNNIIVEKNIPLTHNYGVAATGKFEVFKDFLMNLDIGDSFLITTEQMKVKNVTSITCFVSRVRKLFNDDVNFRIQTGKVNDTTIRVWKIAK